MKTNWTRGLLRLWSALTLLWITGSVYFAVTDPSIPSLTRDCEELRSFLEEKSTRPLGDVAVNQCKDIWATKRVALLEQIMGPPFGALILGVLMAWVIRGFRLRQS